MKTRSHILKLIRDLLIDVARDDGTQVEFIRSRLRAARFYLCPGDSPADVHEAGRLVTEAIGRISRLRREVMV